MRTTAIMLFLCCLLYIMETPPASANKFHHQATIDNITQTTIVIDDREHRLTASIRFYSANNKEISREAFAKGQKINFELNEKNELVSVWQYAPQRE
ncbi:MAG: hypothetical protein Q8O45_05680 [Desulfurivibrionaceae bacterium]|nr:hypothetical protein [Desulfurivibrionaceae bacterium]